MAVTTPSGLPAAFLEPFAEKITDILAQQIAPIGEGLDISGITPKVAAVSPLVQQAQQRAVTQAGLGQLQFDPTTGEVAGVGAGTGVAAFEPFVQEAQRLAAPEQYQAFMSPFQTEVLDATQALLDEQRAAGRAGQAADAITAGAFGGGREGVRRAEYERQRDIYDAGILANLRQQGLQQAQTLQQQALANQLGIGQAQQQLDITATSRLGQAGTGAQAYSQSVLDAIRQGNILAEEFPLQQLGRATNIFSPLLQGQAALQTPATPIGTSPGLAAAQAFGATFGPVLQSTQRPLPQLQQQPTGGQFGIASLYGGI
jgi:hypothetical protein